MGQARREGADGPQSVDPRLSLAQYREVFLDRCQRPRQPERQDPEDDCEQHLRGEEDRRGDELVVESVRDEVEGLDASEAREQHAEVVQAQSAIE